MNETQTQINEIQYQITAQELLDAIVETDTYFICHVLRKVVRGYFPKSSKTVMNELIRNAPKGWIKKNRDEETGSLCDWFKRSKTTKYTATEIRKKYLEKFIEQNGADYLFTFTMGKYRSTPAERD